MILTDREIKIALGRGSLIIDLHPDERAFASTSVDLTLDPAFSEFRQLNAGLEITIDPALDGFDHDAAMEQVTEGHVIPVEGYALAPRKLILGWSAEYIDLRNDARLAARVEGKSSLARLGLACACHRTDNSRWLRRPHPARNNQSWAYAYPPSRGNESLSAYL